MGLAASKNEALWEACGFGHAHRAKKLIEEGCDVNWVSYTHNSCAIHVASQGKEEIVKMLIDAKCNINVKDDRGNLALHHAAMKGHAKIMQMLIDAGSEINTQDKNGWTPLLNAAYFCQPDAVEMLIKNNCDVTIMTKDQRHALHEACRSQSEDQNGLAIIACHLVEAGCDMNIKSSDVGEADFTSLMFAAYHGHAEMAEVLMEAGCDVNAQGTNGWTALHWAADRGHREVMRVLLEWGLDPLLEGRRGELAVDRVQDNEIQEMLAEVTSEAKAQREEEQLMSRSPVSTTSPLSSRSTSCASNLDADREDTPDPSHAATNIDDELVARLETVAKERVGTDSNDQNTKTGEAEKPLSAEKTDEICPPKQKIDDNRQSEEKTDARDMIDNDMAAKLETVTTDREAESSCTSGTISEKDEKEALEKDINNTPPCCESLPEDGTAMSGSSDTSKETVTMVMTEGVLDSSDSERNLEGCDDCYSAERKADEDITISSSQHEDTKTIESTSESVNNSQLGDAKAGNVSGTSDNVGNNTQSTKQQEANSETLSDNTQKATSSTTAMKETDDDLSADLASLAVKEHSQETTNADSESMESSPPKPDAVTRLLAEVSHDDGNLSDDLLGDGGYSDDLIDSDND